MSPARPAVDHDRELGMWRLHRQADVRAALLDPETFRPDNALGAVHPLAPETVRALACGGVALAPALANNGTAGHPGLRRLVARFVTAGAVRAAAPVIEALADARARAAADELAGTGRCDLVAAVTRDLPVEVLFHLLGVPAAQRPAPSALTRWSEASFELFWGRPDPARQAALAAEVVDLHRWLRERLAAARVPGAGEDGLFGALAAHRGPRGGPLPDRDAVSAASFTVLAGHQTTAWFLAQLFERVLATRGLWDELARRTGRVGDVVEEALSLDSSVTSWRRVTSCPVTVSGTTIPAGADVLLTLVDTEPAPARGAGRGHLAFGAGAHHCLGAELARTEATIALRAVTRHLPSATLAAGPTAARVDLLSFSAPREVVVTDARAPSPTGHGRRAR